MVSTVVPSAVALLKERVEGVKAAVVLALLIQQFNCCINSVSVNAVVELLH